MFNFFNSQPVSDEEEESHEVETDEEFDTRFDNNDERYEKGFLNLYLFLLYF